MKNSKHFLKAYVTALFLSFSAITAYSQSGEKWSFGGNSPSGNAAFGTNNWFPIVFKSNNTPYMWLTPTGNLGLGLNNPAYKFDVNGRAHISGSIFADSSMTLQNLFAVQKVTADALQVNNLAVFGNKITIDGANSSISSSSGLLNFGSNNLQTSGNITGNIFTGNAVKISGLGGDGTRLITADNTGNLAPFSFSGNSNEVLYGNGQWGALPAAPQTYWQQNGNNIYANNTGNIGIGTSTPVAKLDVWGSQRITENLFVGGEVIVSDKFSARTVKADTTVATKRLLVNHNLKLGSDSGSVESDIASKTELLKIQSDPAAIYDVAISADNSSKVGIGTKFPTEKLTVVGNARIDGNATINGQLTTGNITSSTLTTNSIQTSQLTITDGTITSDTLHAIKQLIVNNSLKIAKEDINNFAEVSTKDTAVTLVLQKEEAAQVVIGTATVPAPIPLPGQAKDKLTVIGNTLLQGDVNVNGNLKVSGVLTGITGFDSLHVQNRIKVGNSIHIDNYDGSLPGYHNNHIYTTTTDAAIDDPTLYLQSNWGDNPSNPGATNNYNTIINFDNYGMVGIGINNPQEKLDVGGTGRFGFTNGHVKIGFNNVHGFIDSDSALMINWYSGNNVVIGGENSNEGTFTSRHSAYLAANDGNVGVGTASPTSKLHTVASGEKNADYTGNLLTNTATLPDGQYTKAGVEITSTGHWGKGATNIGLFVSSVTGADNNYDAIFNGGGNVGIGTTSPKDQLQIGDNYNKVAIGGLGSNSVLGYSTSYIGFNAVRNNATAQWEFCADGNQFNWSHNAGGVITQNIGGGMIFIPVQTYATSAIRTMSDEDLYSRRVMEILPIDPLHANLGGLVKVNGDISIGSGVKIYNNGNIWASTEVKVAVNNPWGDFVFDKEYNLKTLTELEQYIKENKHLPDVPSAKEIEKNGVSLGEMSNTLLQKIEECILYIIELKKQNDVLQIENNEIKARITKIEGK